MSFQIRKEKSNALNPKALKNLYELTVWQSSF